MSADREMTRELSERLTSVRAVGTQGCSGGHPSWVVNGKTPPQALSRLGVQMFPPYPWGRTRACR